MKVLFPKNIQKGLFSGLSFNIGPLSVSIIQLFILAGGLAFGLIAFNAAGPDARVLGAILGIFIFAIFAIIAFFKISELPLVPFFTKLLQNNFFDTKKKKQEFHEKIPARKIEIAESKIEEKKAAREPKTEQVDKKLLREIEENGLI